MLNFWHPIGTLLNPNLEAEYILAWPSLDVCEEDTSVKILVDVPGVEAKDIDINLKNGILIISGKRQRQEEKSDTKYRSQFHERTFGSFTRSIQLTDETDPDSIVADLKNGVLTIIIAKVSRTKKIEVRVS